MKPRKSILVVDDEPCVRDICAQFLSLSGYEVTTTGSGEEALEVIARKSFHLLILDLAMQGIDGLTTYRHLKAIAPETRAVIVSGSLDRFESQLRHAQDDGLAGILAKPFALKDLSNLVESALGRRRRAA